MDAKFDCNKHKVPYTHISNMLISLFFALGLPVIVLKPMAYGVLFAGTVVAQFYPKGMSEKYGHSINFIKFSDIIIHWLPVILLHIATKNKKINGAHMLIAVLVPFVYMMYDFSKLKVLNIFTSIKDVYPKVPLKILIGLYIFGIVMPYMVQFCSKNVSKWG